jgi:hypothetical protein
MAVDIYYKLQYLILDENKNNYTYGYLRFYEK